MQGYQTTVFSQLSLLKRIFFKDHQTTLENTRWAEGVIYIFLSGQSCNGNFQALSSALGVTILWFVTWFMPSHVPGLVYACRLLTDIISVALIFLRKEKHFHIVYMCPLVMGRLIFRKPWLWRFFFVQKRALPVWNFAWREFFHRSSDCFQIVVFDLMKGFLSKAKKWFGIPGRSATLTQRFLYIVVLCLWPWYVT